MPESQLVLFPEPRPFLQRFGADFFRALPRRPGVYLMTDGSDRVLYIGKTRNLRQRLSSYKYPGPSRKLWRLAGRVRSITWELCDDGFAASLRENELLRLHKPAFNTMNTRAEHYPFIGLLTFHDESMALRFTKMPRPSPGEQLFGAFKGLPLARAAFAALLRCLWRLEHPGLSLLELPSWLISSAPQTFRVSASLARRCRESLARFLSGDSDALLASLDSLLPYRAGHFEQAFHAQDVKTLAEFFARGPQRNSILRAIFDLPEPGIPQADLDDLLVLRDQYANPVAPQPTVS